MPSNLPPGITDAMLPGNTPEDEALEKIWNIIENDVDYHGFSAHELASIWKNALESIGKTYNVKGD